MVTVRFIARGGFGEVHEVSEGGHHFARKTFACPPHAIGDSDAEEKFLRRFQREVRVQSCLDHPNIVRIIASDLTGSPPWFTMPLADESLEATINAKRVAASFDTELNIFTWQDILSGVEELHRLGYVHRDLKPANVLRFGSTWAVSDFGLVLPTVRESTMLTSSHSAYGSHFYAAPEQANDFRNAPEQTDIFALGCMLSDCLDRSPNRVPYAQVCSNGLFGNVIAKCTEVDPRNRYESVAALRAAIFEVFTVVSGAPVSEEETDRVQAVIDLPHSAELWRDLIVHVEELETFSRHFQLKAISSDLLLALRQSDDVLFGRMMGLVCDWGRSTGFDWSYCDVVGDRLIAAYRVSPVRIQCEIVLAALELAVSHNRWHVMYQVGAMLGQTAAPGLVERIIIETDDHPKIMSNLFRIENAVTWPRENWHPTLRDFLSSQGSEQA